MGAFTLASTANSTACSTPASKIFNISRSATPFMLPQISRSGTPAPIINTQPKNFFSPTPSLPSQTFIGNFEVYGFDFDTFIAKASVAAAAAHEVQVPKPFAPFTIDINVVAADLPEALSDATSTDSWGSNTTATPLAMSTNTDTKIPFPVMDYSEISESNVAQTSLYNQELEANLAKALATPIGQFTSGCPDCPDCQAFKGKYAAQKHIGSRFDKFQTAGKALWSRSIPTTRVRRMAFSGTRYWSKPSNLVRQVISSSPAVDLEKGEATQGILESKKWMEGSCDDDSAEEYVVVDIMA